MTTMDRLCGLILKLNKKHITASDLTSGASLAADLMLDSLDMAELLVLAEDEFNITIPLDDAKSMTTIGAAVQYFDERAAQRG